MDDFRQVYVIILEHLMHVSPARALLVSSSQAILELPMPSLFPSRCSKALSGGGPPSPHSLLGDTTEMDRMEMKRGQPHAGGHLNLTESLRAG